jgi:hypothetical protein
LQAWHCHRGRGPWKCPAINQLGALFAQQNLALLHFGGNVHVPAVFVQAARAPQHANALIVTTATALGLKRFQLHFRARIIFQCVKVLHARDRI